MRAYWIKKLHMKPPMSRKCDIVTEIEMKINVSLRYLLEVINQLVLNDLSDNWLFLRKQASDELL